MMLKQIFLVIAAALMLTACGGGDDTPEAVAKEFAEAVVDGDVDDVIDTLHIPEKELEKPGRQEAIEGKITAMIGDRKAKFADKQGVDSISIGEVAYRDNDQKATVSVTMKFGDGSEKRDRLRLIRTDEGWKIRL